MNYKKLNKEFKNKNNKIVLIAFEFMLGKKFVLFKC